LWGRALAANTTEVEGTSGERKEKRSHKASSRGAQKGKKRGMEESLDRTEGQWKIPKSEDHRTMPL